MHLGVSATTLKLCIIWQGSCTCIGKQRALSREVTCNFRLNLNLGRTSVEQSWNHWIFTSKYRCLHTEVPYYRPYGWNRPKGKVQCSLFTYTHIYDCIHYQNNLCTV